MGKLARAEYNLLVKDTYLYIFIFFQPLRNQKKMTLWAFLNKFWTRRCKSNRRSWLGPWLGRWAVEIDKSDFLFMSRKPECLERFQLCMSPNPIFKSCPFFCEWCNQPGKRSSFPSFYFFILTTRSKIFRNEIWIFMHLCTQSSTL